jgi:predicted Fe-S protein YdhL (DUF1289 family)
MPIETPCIKICEIDQASQLCRGCGRSLQEIAHWGRYSPAERSRIMRELATRDVPRELHDDERH